MDVGIYEIHNVVSNKRYIGSSTVVTKRLQNHKSSLKRGDHVNKYLQSAWNKYKEESFIFKPILICAKEHLLFYEDLIIKGYKSNQKEYGYNLREVCESNANISTLARRYKVGEKHNRLTLIKALGPPSSKTKWLAKCDCGTVKEMSPDSIRNGHSKSCGCLHSEISREVIRKVHIQRRLKRDKGE